MSWHTPHPMLERPLTAEDLIELWRAQDELAPRGSHRPRTPGLLIVARCMTGLFVSSVAVFSGPLLRTVGGA